MKTRVIEQHKNLFKVSNEIGAWWAEPSGRLLFHTNSAADLPVVGDWVEVTEGGPADRLQILSIDQRSTLLARRAIEQDHEIQPLAANVDEIFVVTSLNQDLNPNRLDRYRLLVEQSGARGTLVLTKADLVQDAAELQTLVESVRHLFPQLLITGLDGRGWAALQERLQAGVTAVFIGSSGVGKSTLLNALMGDEIQDTAGIRESDARGRHTTTSRSLITLPSGAAVIDTPGIRELSLWNLDAETLQDGFAQLSTLAQQCRYRDCRHETEPGCAVQAGVAAGTLPAAQLASFKKLQKEQAFYERRQDKQAALAEKNRWKAIHKAVRRDRKARGE